MNKTWDTSAPIPIGEKHILEPCPYCKRTETLSIVLYRKDNADDPLCVRAVMCIPCDYRGPSFINDSIAIEEWNKKVRRKILDLRKSFGSVG